VRPRADLIGALIAPAPRFVWGLLLLLPVALARSWAVSLAEAAIALGLSLLSGKKARPMANLGFLAAMVAFSALSPRGRILLSIGAFPLTEGALLDGLERALTILCMVFVSGFSVSAELRLPGGFGSLLSGVLSRFRALMEARATLDRKDIMGSLDKVLYGVFDPAKFSTDYNPEKKNGGVDADEANTPGWLRRGLGLLLALATLAGATAAAVLTRFPHG
jgi:hypothetical protein